MTQITKIKETDLLSDSRSVINDNFENLNNGKVDKTNILEKDNTEIYVPNDDYHPATKKYVDDNIIDYSDKADKSLTIKNIVFSTNNYDLQTTDNGKYLIANNTLACTITIIDANHSIGNIIHVKMGNIGTVTFALGDGVHTIHHTGGTQIEMKNDVVSLIKEDAGVYNLVGNTKS